MPGRGRGRRGRRSGTKSAAGLAAIAHVLVEVTTTERRGRSQRGASMSARCWRDGMGSMLWKASAGLENASTRPSGLVQC